MVAVPQRRMSPAAVEVEQESATAADRENGRAGLRVAAGLDGAGVDRVLEVFLGVVDRRRVKARPSSPPETMLRTM